MFDLVIDDVVEVEAAGEHDDPEQRKEQRDFVADHLRCSTHTTHEVVFVVSSPAGKEQDQRGKGADCEIIDETDRRIVDGHAFTKRHDGKNHHGWDEDDDRHEVVQELIGTIRGDGVLTDKLQDIHEKLEDTERPHTVWPETLLDEPGDLTFQINQNDNVAQQKDEDDDSCDDALDPEAEGLGTAKAHGDVDDPVAYVDKQIIKHE